MGNTTSQVERRWSEACRSERTTNLDEAHPLGLLRPAMRLGESFSYKEAAGITAGGAKKARTRVVGMRFHTDARAVERQLDGHADAAPSRTSRLTGGRRGSLQGSGPSGGAAGATKVAAWRHGMHAARRRVWLRLLVLVRLRVLARKRGNRPLQSMAELIPLVLREQQAVIAVAQRRVQEMEAVQAHLQALITRKDEPAAPTAQPSAASLHQPPPTPTRQPSGLVLQPTLTPTISELNAGYGAGPTTPEGGGDPSAQDPGRTSFSFQRGGDAPALALGPPPAGPASNRGSRATPTLQTSPARQLRRSSSSNVRTSAPVLLDPQPPPLNVDAGPRSATLVPAGGSGVVLPTPFGSAAPPGVPPSGLPRRASFRGSGDGGRLSLSQRTSQDGEPSPKTPTSQAVPGGGAPGALGRSWGTPDGTSRRTRPQQLVTEDSNLGGVTLSDPPNRQLSASLVGAASNASSGVKSTATSRAASTLLPAVETLAARSTRSSGGIAPRMGSSSGATGALANRSASSGGLLLAAVSGGAGVDAAGASRGSSIPWHALLDALHGRCDDLDLLMATPGLSMAESLDRPSAPSVLSGASSSQGGRFSRIRATAGAAAASSGGSRLSSNGVAHEPAQGNAASRQASHQHVPDGTLTPRMGNSGGMTRRASMLSLTAAPPVLTALSRAFQSQAGPGPLTVPPPPPRPGMNGSEPTTPSGLGGVAGRIGEGAGLSQRINALRDRLESAPLTAGEAFQQQANRRRASNTGEAPAAAGALHAGAQPPTPTAAAVAELRAARRQSEVGSGSSVLESPGSNAGFSFAPSSNTSPNPKPPNLTLALGSNPGGAAAGTPLPPVGPPSGSGRTSAPSLGTKQPLGAFTVQAPEHGVDMRWAQAQLKRVKELPASQHQAALQALAGFVAQQQQQAAVAMQACLSRCNTASVDGVVWKVPELDATPGKQAWAESPHFAAWAFEVKKLIRQGHVAVQLFADSDVMLLPDGQLVDLWGVDPWHALALDGVEQPSARAVHMEGVTMGTRILTQLALLAQQVSGSEDCASRLPIILHIHDGQRDQVEADMRENAVYARLAPRLLVVEHPRQPAFRWEAERWAADGQSALQPVGDGLSMLQLTWSGQVLSVPQGPAQQPHLQWGLERQDKPAIEFLQDWGVKWLVTWHARDCHLWTPSPFAKPLPGHTLPAPAGGASPGLSDQQQAGQGHPLDLGLLAFCMHMHKDAGITAFMQASHPSPASPMLRGALGGGSDAGLDRVVLQPVRSAARKSGAGAAQTAEEEEALLQLLNIKTKAKAAVPRAAELSSGRLASAHMSAALAAAQRGLAGAQLPVSCQRYVFHLPSLSGALESPLALRPSAHMSGSQVRVRLELSDLTLHHRVAPLAVQAVGGPPRVLLSASDMASWSSLLQAQDAALHELQSKAAAGPGAAARNVVLWRPEQNAVPHSIVAILLDDGLAPAAASAAALLARPGIDRVHLVTLVASQAAAPGGQELLEAHAAAVRERGVHVELLVQARSQSTLGEALGAALSQCRASMLVMGSLELTAGISGSDSAASSNAVAGSLLHFVLRNFPMPTLVVTTKCAALKPANRVSGAGSQQQPQPGAGRPSAGLRCMLAVEGHSRPLLHFLGGLLASKDKAGSSNHKLYLAQAYLPKATSPQLCSSLRSLADKFTNIATSYSLMDTQQLVLEPPADKALLAAVKQYALHLLALQLPPDSGQPAGVLPPDVLNVLRGSSVPVLVHPRRHVDPAHGAGAGKDPLAALRSSRVFVKSMLAAGGSHG